MGRTSIEWTDVTWNPVRGCSRVSSGCSRCYAEAVAARFSGPGQPYEGLAVMKSDGPHWTGKVVLVEDKLTEPLRWRKPRRVFVNSMSDLFHESVPDEWIDHIFAVMALAPQHTFQILTKRAQRMREYCLKQSGANLYRAFETLSALLDGIPANRTIAFTERGSPWPLPNVWLGVSVENQQTADERMPLLLETPAAVRWVSYEPALAAVDFSFEASWDHVPCGFAHGPALQKLDWLVIGGESGPGARPFDVAWARQTIAQCKAAGIACFCKQLGSNPFYHDAGERDLKLRDRKGGDMAEWSADLRVREWPKGGA